MTRAWGRWITRISFGIVATLAAATAALYVAARGNAETALLFALVIVDPLFSNSRPPAIADSLFTSWDWRHWGDDDRRLTSILERGFPVGTNETRLKSILLNQGFKPLAAPPQACLPQGQPSPVGKPSIHVPHTIEARCSSTSGANFPADKP